MQPVKFKGSNVVFAENQPEYLPLPAFKDASGEVVTCWKMTLVERLKFLFTGRFYLRVSTFNQPLQPLLPSVENPIIIS
jgi:hypothetical protein